MIALDLELYFPITKNINYKRADFEIYVLALDANGTAKI